MWLLLAFTSAALLGFYDVSKKTALKDNAVLPVLLFNTFFCSLIFLPFLIDSIMGSVWFGASGMFGTTPFKDGEAEYSIMHAHLLIAVKALAVLISWVFGYMGMKHLPITIVGPINATRPVMVLVGAMLIFGERLNAWQWAGVILAIISLFLLGRSGRKEQVDFRHNRWIWCIGAAAVTGAGCGLYDKYLLTRLNPMFVQSWYTFYQFILMGTVCTLIRLPEKGKGRVFRWSWAIPLISIFVSAADFAYFSALSRPDSMISVVSLIRRGSVLVSFACGAVIFREKNLKSKAADLILILIGMIFIYIGSK